MVDLEKFDWLHFATSNQTKPKRKEEQSEAEKTKMEIDEFLERMNQTLSELWYFDPDVSSKLFVEARQELEEVQQFFDQLGQRIDTSRSDWLSLLAPATKEELLKRTKRLNELQKQIQHFTKAERGGARKQHLQAPPGFKTPLRDPDRQLVMRLEQALKVMNSLAMRLNPHFDPRPGM